MVWPSQINEWVSQSVTHKYHIENNTVYILHEATEIKATGNKVYVGV